MSRAARSRAARKRIPPYAWLGAGAVTLGMGVAMVGGPAVAFADTGVDGADTAAAGASTAGPSADSGQPTRKSAANRAGRGADATSDAAPAGASSATAPRAVSRAARMPAAPAVTAPGAALAVEAAPDLETAPADAGTATEAVTAQAPPSRREHRDQVLRSPALAPVLRPAEAPAPAAVPGPAADPAPEMTSWLPGGSNPGSQIVPGSHVALALQEIEATQAILQAQTWGSGNILAGLAAIAPQVLLAGASLSLSAWGANMPGAQSFLAGTAGIPIIQQIAQVNLLVTTALPSIAETSMAVAAFLLPVVGLFGADISAAETELAAARSDGRVYAVVPVRVTYGTQPLVDVSINGGSSATVLVDTGASGLITTRDKVPTGGLGPAIGTGSISFSGAGGQVFNYTTYQTTVDFGGGVVTEPTPVNIVDAEDDAAFKNFLSWGADGILGVGANTAGPGPAPVPTASLPGELSSGFLLYQGVFLGLFGVMVFGLNPLPVRVSVPGAPVAYVQVSVNDQPKTDAGAIIDSGGVFGTLAAANDPTGTPVGSNLPAGTRISVYTADGSTLLYSYTTKGGASGTPVIASGLMNTGNAPFAQGPVYVNYGYDDPYGIGSTDFSIW